LERYRELAERQIIPHLGETKLQKLTPEAVRQWHSTLLGQGLAPRTVGHAHRLLQLVLGCAVTNGTLTRNVAAVNAVPKVEDTEYGRFGWFVDPEGNRVELWQPQ